MALNTNSFVIDKAVKCYMVSPSTGDILWTLSELVDPTMNVTSETREKTNAMGATIATFNNGSAAEFSASNALFDLSLSAAQFGTERNVASETNKIRTPRFETHIVPTGTSEITLDKVPVGVSGAEIKKIYILNGDNTINFNNEYVLGSSPSATEFTLDAASKKITLPTGLPDNAQILVKYEYDAVSAIEVVKDATKYPTAGAFYLEVLGHDVCAPDITYVGYLIAPNAKLSTDVELGFDTESNHPFTITCLQNYCDPQKRLFSIVIPED